MPISAAYFFAPPGYYRFIAFVISDNFSEVAADELSTTAARERLKGGLISLPSEYDEKLFSEDHEIQALIYEFEKGSADGDAKALDPGRYSVYEHLQSTSLSSALFDGIGR